MTRNLQLKIMYLKSVIKLNENNQIYRNKGNTNLRHIQIWTTDYMIYEFYFSHMTSAKHSSLIADEI